MLNTFHGIVLNIIHMVVSEYTLVRGRMDIMWGCMFMGWIIYVYATILIDFVSSAI